MTKPGRPVSRLRLAAAILAAALFVAVAPFRDNGTAANEIPVDLELILAVDISGSMDFDELQIQRRGYVEALRHPDVIRAIESGFLGRIAISMVEWAGPASQRTVLPWRLIETGEDAISASEVLGAQPINNMRGTSISGLLNYTRDMFTGNGYSGTRQVIDISGDGPNRSGGLVTAARDRTLDKGIIINGLPIVLSPGIWSTSALSPDELALYYEDCVIGGFSSFIIAVQAKEELVTAIRRKMILEIASATPRIIPAAMQLTEPRIDCLIGEKRWQQRMQQEIE